MSGIYRDIVTSHLREDTRILSSVLGMRRIFQNPLYDIHLCIYSGLMNSIQLNADLVTCLIIFKQENLRLMFKLWTADIQGNRDEYIERAIQDLEAQGKSPLHLIRDAKVWCRAPFTEEDRAFFAQHGFELPTT